ncbi:hypothetical protein ACI6QG_19550, partial [Roseococcus sp. DSY-14]|uniref:hypothetical protein n=1 Tax=Roseococcus sp. DSY-14 TaxID=3369650 RepID=UPI00387AFE8C
MLARKAAPPMLVASASRLTPPARERRAAARRSPPQPRSLEAAMAARIDDLMVLGQNISKTDLAKYLR